MKLIIILNISIILSAIIIIIALYLNKIENKIKKEIKSNSPEVINKKYHQKIKNIQGVKNEEEKMKKLVLFCKEFIKERYSISEEKDFYELSRLFQSNGKKELSELCNKLTEYYYANKKQAKNQVKEIFILMKKSINEAIPLPIPNEELTKKNLQSKNNKIPRSIKIRKRKRKSLILSKERSKK